MAVLIVTVLAVIAADEAMESWHGHGRSLERPVDENPAKYAPANLTFVGVPLTPMA